MSVTSIDSVKVSILMPVFNAQNTLTECLDSIFMQSLQDFEIIGVDDFSTDRSVEIMQSYNDPRVRVIEK
jgi:glycosyltransferase involved in cell wall biosynthesis